MALFRMAAAAGLLAVLAPEPTAEAVRSMLGLARAAQATTSMAPAEAAIAFCRSHPKVCLEAAGQAAGQAANLGTAAVRPRASSAQP